MGGRIAALDAVYKDRMTIYVARRRRRLETPPTPAQPSKPVFEKYPQSIGAITIDRPNPTSFGSVPGNPGPETASPSATASTSPPTAATTGSTSFAGHGADFTHHHRPQNSDIVYVFARAICGTQARNEAFQTTDGGKS